MTKDKYQFIPSPNFNDRHNNAVPTILVLHYTQTRTSQETIDIF